MVIAGLLVLLIAVGVVYKLACGRKKNLYDDEEEDDDEDDSGSLDGTRLSSVLDLIRKRHR